MTPLEIIRRKKNLNADSCLPPADRLPSLVESVEFAQDAITGPIAPLAEPGFENPVPCPQCGCPAFWLDRRGVLRCGGCRPPTFAALVDCWLLAVLVPFGPFGGGNVWRWEPLRPRFKLARLKKIRR